MNLMRANVRGRLCEHMADSTAGVGGGVFFGPKATWDVFGPADVDHQLPVGQVTQCGQSLDVALGHGGVGHGKDALRLGHQQHRHHFVFHRVADGD